VKTIIEKSEENNDLDISFYSKEWDSELIIVTPRDYVEKIANFFKR